MLVLRYSRRTQTFAAIAASVVLIACLSTSIAARRWHLPERPPSPRKHWDHSDFGVYRFEFPGSGLGGELVVSPLQSR